MANTNDILKLQAEYACPTEPRSTVVHEIFHWKDAEEYRKQFGAITDSSRSSKYSMYQREKARQKLVEAGVDIANVDDVSGISQYAIAKQTLKNDIEEVYTEYRTKVLCEGDAAR